MPMFIQTEIFQQWVNRQRVFTQISTNLDIFLDVQICNQVILLKNISQMHPAILCQLLFVHLFHFFATNDDGAAVRLINSANDVQQRGLSGSGRPQQHTNFALFQLHINAFQDFYSAFPAPEAFPNIFHFKNHRSSDLSVCHAYASCVFSSVSQS